MRLKNIVIALGLVLLPIGISEVHSSSVSDYELAKDEGATIVKLHESWKSQEWKEVWENEDVVNHLYGYSDYIVSRSLEVGLNPTLVSALIIYETDWGTSNALVQHNNPGGIVDLDTYQIKSFDTMYEGIDFTIENLDNLITEHEIVTIQRLSSIYAPVENRDKVHPLGINVEWIKDVLKITKDTGGFDGRLKEEL